MQAGGAPTVLLVEDDRRLRGIVQMILEESGYRVLSAETRSQAQSLWREHSEGINLLLTDWRLGDATGRELAEALKKDKPGLHVIYASGHALDDIGGGVLKPEKSCFLKKPFTERELLQRVQGCLVAPAAGES